MKHKITFIAALGAAAFALTASQAGAQQVQAQTSDLLLCFETTTGVGSTINLEVDLGNFASPSVMSLNIATDLVNDYGSNWASRTDLTWAVIGTNYQSTPPGKYTLIGSALDSAGAGTSVGPNKQSQSGENIPSTDINNTYSLFNGGNATAGATVYSETVDNTTGGSFGEDQIALDTSIFQHLEQGMPDDGSFSGNQSSVDLWESIGGSNPSTGTVSDINTITLNDAGQITVGAVPEPSTWASIALGAAALVGLRRRRSA